MPYQFDGQRTKIWLGGTLGFGKDPTLTFRSAPAGTREAARGANVRVLQISGSVESPKVSLKTVGAAGAKP